jgi:hypothetical protein
MTPNNRSIWFAIGLLAVVLLALKIPSSWQVGTPERSDALMAAAASDSNAAGTPGDAQGAVASPNGVSQSATTDETFRQWILKREIEQEADERLEKNVKLGVGGVISIAILLGAFFIVLRKGSPAPDRNWAFGTIGAILGYWIGR